VLEEEVQVRDLPGARRAHRFAGTIEFEHLTFAYEDRQRSLKDVSLRIDYGQVAALVGPTGSGKSTLLSLIPRFYDANSGSVRIDGRDVRSYKLESLRNQISFVLQETLLFRAPVWQNIAYGKPDATQQEIIRAAKLANAHEFIVDMPDGYDSMVGERGVTLSGGQRQRIAIARAVIRNSPILILDEPTSGLDAQSERTVCDALRRLMAGRTSVIAAHRLSTIVDADVIFVLDQGRIIEEGTHQELLEIRGMYAKLWDIQSRSDEYRGLSFGSRLAEATA